MMKPLVTSAFLLSLLVVGCSTTRSGVDRSDTLQLTSFSVLDGLMQKDPRPIAVFIHTDWCQYCQGMRQRGFRDPQVVQLLNSRYYFISFDAEQEEEVVFQGQTFAFQPTGRNTGTHALAQALGSIEGVLTYPSFVLLNADFEIIFQHNAYLTGSDLQKILVEAM